MDSFSSPDVETVVVMSSSQVGKTEMFQNVIGYYASVDPSPILIVQPTLQVAEEYSKDRLMTMIRDTPDLAIRFKTQDQRLRETTFHKEFVGGRITIAGANSPASLAARSVRIVLCDEVDRYPISAGSEGDPISLAVKRASTFWNKKIGLFSTPTIEGMSRIERSWKISDQRYFLVPCPSCSHFQRLVWDNVRWQEGAPDDAYYECSQCKHKITDQEKLKILRRGDWIPTKPEARIVGFHLNALYSPWTTFGSMAIEYVEAHHHGREAMKVFVNTVLGEVWKEPEQGEISIYSDDFSRLLIEDQGAIPEEFHTITCGIDVQQNYLVAEVVAWADDLKSLGLGYHYFMGSPLQQTVWQDLDIFIKSTYKHASGRDLPISATCIDSGAFTQIVYSFVKPRQHRRIFAIKGKGTAGAPVVCKPTHPQAGLTLFTVGTDAAKTMIRDFLSESLKTTKAEKCFGYMKYFSDRGYDDEYFRQLTAERITLKYVGGIPVRKWEKPPHVRNEALDCRVYALAAYYISTPTLKGGIQQPKQGKEKIPNRRKSSWVRGY